MFVTFLVWVKNAKIDFLKKMVFEGIFFFFFFFNKIDVKVVTNLIDNKLLKFCLWWIFTQF